MSKLGKTIKDNKKHFIVVSILWAILAVILVSPIAYSIAEATDNGIFDIAKFIEKLIPEITSFSSITKVLTAEYIGVFGKTLLYFTIFYAIFVTIMIFKSKPKKEYADIEHGSSDWCEGGEQYKILSKNKGIILAQDNYLPVDKRGNINVLVVGRFWFW